MIERDSFRRSTPAFYLSVVSCLVSAVLGLLESVPMAGSSPVPSRRADDDPEWAVGGGAVQDRDRQVKPGSAIELKVWPAEINLTHAKDRQSVIAQLVLADQTNVDVSDQVQTQLADPLMQFQDRYWRPVSDGQTQLEVRFQDLSQTIPVNVSGCQSIPAVSFINDVVPIFSKTGCNAGSCHGASRGKDGFGLSLYGFDPRGDYDRLTRELPGRRVNLASPEQCLLMAKATGAVPHSGGQLMKPDSEHFQTLINWLRAGAKFDAATPAKVTSIELFPESAVLKRGDQQRLSVVAHYDDGSDRDVTSLAYFSTNRDNVASVANQGLVRAHQPGESFVMCRFDTHTVGREFIVFSGAVDFQWNDIQPFNEIDEAIHAKLKRLQIRPSQVSGDAEFLRRVSIDICGQLPSVEQVKTFVASPDPNKRTVLIDELLERPEFLNLWVMRWAELLQIRSSNLVSYKETVKFYQWLKSRAVAGESIDQIVRQVLVATGHSMRMPQASFFHAEADFKKLSENVAQAFLGMRIQCAQCHNHPFDRWTMEDYYGFTAFFARIARKRADDPRAVFVFDRPAGEAKHPVTKAKVTPKFLGGEAPVIKGQFDRRQVVADWITSPDNPYFAKNIANIVWAHFFGRGIVDQVDDVRVSNPPANSRLHGLLAGQLIESGFDIKQLVRKICNSRTYQLSAEVNDTNRHDQNNFSHARYRRIRAEVLLDVISDVTETKNKFRGLPLGAQAVQIADGNTSNYFLKTFGRSSRSSVCACEVKMEPSLSQALHLLNGDTVHQKIVQGKVVQQLMAAEFTNKEIIDHLYQRCLSRPATEKEVAAIVAQVQSLPDRRLALEDVFWALLNSREFVFNH